MCLNSRNEKEQEDTSHKSLENITTLQVTEPPPPPFDPIKRMKEGFNYFKVNEFNKNPSYYRKLAEKPEPKFLIFACSDSRVCPATILNLRPGEAFMTLNIANMVPTFNQVRYCEVGAVIRYVILTYKVEAIVVIGHTRCGGIERLMSIPSGQTKPRDFVDDWVTIGQPAKAKVLAKNPKATGEELRTLVEKESVMNSLGNLLSYPYVKAGVTSKKLKLIGGYYDFVRGNFDILGSKS
ncbi:hypothetical protein L1887_35220 [Cichorium endivia]|nr:hypothetical protein L1887_35220 [Cichorium endivia]